ncbi:MAG: hypothetical protein HYY13_13090 [Nitrospirae bacterium]|nr:hypothetical protein [Nitrospirota bacterium]
MAHAIEIEIDQKGEAICQSLPYKDEAELQKLLADHPSIIPVGQIWRHSSALCLVEREQETGAGPVDLTFVDENGRILVVECKLASDGRARREVVAQGLEYVAHLVRQGPAGILGKQETASRGQESLLARFWQRGLDTHQKWVERFDSREAWTRVFKKNMEMYLRDPEKLVDRQGVALLLAADSVPDSALVLSDFVNILCRRRKRPLVYCMEVRKFLIGDRQVCVANVRAAALLKVEPVAQEQFSLEDWLLGNVDDEDSQKYVELRRKIHEALVQIASEKRHSVEVEMGTKVLMLKWRIGPETKTLACFDQVGLDMVLASWSHTLAIPSEIEALLADLSDSCGLRFERGKHRSIAHYESFRDHTNAVGALRDALDRFMTRLENRRS